MQLRPFLGTVAALAMTAVVSLGMASPALAVVTYPPETGSATVSATTVSAGGTVTVNGTRFCAGTVVTATVSQQNSVYITRTARADSQGKVSFRLKLTKPGINTIKLTGRQADCTGVRVLGVKVTATGGTGAVGAGLPGTGGVNLTPLWAGLGLLAAGALLVSVAHSRRRILV